MDTFLLLILLIIIGYLSFQFVNKKLQRKFLYKPGFEFLLLGILIGEPFISFINNKFQLALPIIPNEQGLIQLRPVIAAVLGAVGFSVGLQFRVKELFNFSIEQFKLSIFDSILTLLIMSSLSYLVMRSFLQNLISIENLVVNSLIIGLTASTLSIYVLEVLKNKFQIEGENFNTLSTIPKLNNFISISFVGLIFALNHKGTTKIISFTPIEWFVISILISLLLGFLFFIFLEREETENKLFLALLGIIIFSSGSAYFLNLSPLFFNLLVGFVIGNLIKSKDALTEFFKKMESPFHIIILIYAGTLIKIDNFYIFIVGLVSYLIIRYLLKFFIGWFAFNLSLDKSKFDKSIGKGLTSQGIIAIAIVINFQQVFNNPFMNTIFAIVIFSSLINDILSTKFTKDLLIDLNEIK